MNRKQKKMLGRILSAAACLIMLRLLDAHLSPWQLKLALYMIPYLIVGYDILGKALHGIRSRQVFDENFLMAVATIGAVGVGVYNALHGGEDDYLEAVAVMLLYQVGELFQNVAVGRSRRNISELMDIRPDVANLVGEDGEAEEVDPDEVETGSLILVHPGEKIPIDGVVEEGESSLNTAALTGESAPRDVRPGSAVLSGCINMTGLLKIRTTAEFEESTASKILDLVENAASLKSRSENFITRFARYYTPVVCAAALALAVLPPVLLLLAGRAPRAAEWIYRACTFLVISCPCAVVISIPLSFFAGLGAAGSRGILITGSNYLEALASVKTLVFDKTGTITRGNFAVTEVKPAEGSREELLELAAHLEAFSTHPIAESLRRAYGKTPDPGRVTEVQEISGRGVTSKVDGIPAAAGSRKLMEQLGIPCGDPSCTGTVVHVAGGGRYRGYIVIADEVKPESRQAIDALKRCGVEKTVMLTGDAAAVAEAVARETGIDEFHAGLLPGDKVARVESLLAENAGRGRLAFAGDGINDAPVLARADIGIAMGALGSDAAVEAADVVLMDDNPLKIAEGIRISRRCLRIVQENIGFALGVKGVCLILGALGFANMWVAVMADVGVMILCVLNAIRVLFIGGGRAGRIS